MLLPPPARCLSAHSNAGCRSVQLEPTVISAIASPLIQHASLYPPPAPAPPPPPPPPPLHFCHPHITPPWPPSIAPSHAQRRALLAQPPSSLFAQSSHVRFAGEMPRVLLQPPPEFSLTFPQNSNAWDVFAGGVGEKRIAIDGCSGPTPFGSSSEDDMRVTCAAAAALMQSALADAFAGQEGRCSCERGDGAAIVNSGLKACVGLCCCAFCTFELTTHVNHSPLHSDTTQAREPKRC